MNLFGATSGYGSKPNKNDYSKFFGRITDRNKRGDILKIHTENSNIKDNDMPSSAECAVDSPKYAILRHTTKQPNGAAARATPIPARAALTMKSSSI